MKSIRKFLIGVVIIGSLAASLNFLHAQTAGVGSFNSNLSLVQAAAPDSIVQITADAQGLPLVLPGQAPRSGTFWWILPSGTAVPAPCPPLDLTAPIYQLAGGQFLVDQTGGQIPAIPRRFGMQAQTTSGTAISGLELEADTVLSLITRVQTGAANQQMRMMSLAMGMNDSSGPMPGGDGGGGGDDTNGVPFFGISYTPPTNGLWLEITNVSNGYAWLNLHNATNQVYEILSKTDLSAAAWNIETELWPADTNCMPFTVPVLDRTNTLFVWAQDWTGVTENGNTTPDWWFWKYYGTVNLSDASLDANSNSLLSDYTNSVAPAVFTFSEVQVANNYVSTTPTTAQLNVTGLPYYVAVLVDDANFNDAVWNAYSSPNVAVNLWPQGWHDVWIGLRGHADDASAAVWQYKRLKLDYTPPSLVITSPTNSIMPMIQLTGYSPEALASISYDLSNAVAVVTNQQAFITDQSYSTNTWEFTTNYFQCFDVPLTNGVNTITLHATDLAGNMTTLATNIICTGNTNLPGVTLLWPQDGMQISGDSFTIQGQVDDPTASVSVTAVDSSGNTNVINGRTGRDGIFWIENVPLNADTTTLALTLSNAAGDTTTNFSVSQSSVGLSVDAVQAGDTTVNVSIDTDGYTVWVNGVEATNNGGGSWTAQITPICIGGGLVQVTAVPNGGGGYGMANNRSQSMENNSQNQNVNTQATVQSPQGVYISSYQDNWQGIQGDDYVTDNNFSTISWRDGFGGSGVRQWEENLQVVDNYTWPATNWPKPLPYGTDNYVEYYFNGYGIAYSNTFVADPPSLAMEQCKISQNYTNTSQGWWENYSETAHAEVKLATGGTIGSTSMNLWVISASATKYLPPWLNYPLASANIPSQQISILGKTLGADGNLYLLLPDNTNLDITPILAGAPDYYTFNVTAQKYKLHIVVNDTTPLQADRIVQDAYYCVGQKLNFKAVFSPNNLPGVNYTSPIWNYTADYINNHWTDENGCEEYNIAPIPAMSNPTTAWFYNKQTQNVMANLGLYCKFNNGQSVYLIRQGQFNVYSPSLKGMTNPTGPAFVSLYGGNTLAVGTNTGAGDLYYIIYVDSKYSGLGGITQLINGYNYGATIAAPFYSGEDYWLDNGVWYLDKQYSITNIVDWTKNSIPLDDEPKIGCLFTPAGMQYKFNDYVRFKPDGDSDNIFVTLGMITWNVAAEAAKMNGVWTPDSDNSVGGPIGPNSSNAFPLWDSIFNNSLFQ
jgi:hypothetical protein